MPHDRRPLYEPLRPPNRSMITKGELFFFAAIMILTTTIIVLVV